MTFKRVSHVLYYELVRDDSSGEMDGCIDCSKKTTILKNNRENVSKDIKVLLNDSGIANTNNNGNNTSQMRLLNF
jgi:hypothetical protein